MSILLKSFSFTHRTMALTASLMLIASLMGQNAYAQGDEHKTPLSDQAFVIEVDGKPLKLYNLTVTSNSARADADEISRVIADPNTRVATANLYLYDQPHLTDHNRYRLPSQRSTAARINGRVITLDDAQDFTYLAGAPWGGRFQLATDSEVLDVSFSILDWKGSHMVQYSDAFIKQAEDEGRDLDSNAHILADSVGAQIDSTFKLVLQGFAAQLTPDQVNQLLRDSRVKSVRDMSRRPTLAGNDVYQYGDGSDVFRLLDHSDQRGNATDNIFRHQWWGSDQNNDEPHYHAFIIDTGMSRGGDEFKYIGSLDGLDGWYSRIKYGFDATGENDPSNTCDVHGEPVANILAGNTLGVAKRAWIHPVKVAYDAIIYINYDPAAIENVGFMECRIHKAVKVAQAIEWIAQYIVDHNVKNSVVNISFGWQTDLDLEDYISTGDDEYYADDDTISTIEDAIRGSVAATDLSYIVSAGNKSRDACLQTPARMPEVITVGAINASNYTMPYSNRGPCVDIWAVGNTEGNAYSGTSFAAPLVAGAVLAANSWSISRWFWLEPLSSVDKVMAAATRVYVYDNVTSTPTPTPVPVLYIRKEPWSGTWNNYIPGEHNEVYGQGEQN